MDEIEAILFECPFLRTIIDLEAQIGRKPFRLDGGKVRAKRRRGSGMEETTISRCLPPGLEPGRDARAGSKKNPGDFPCRAQSAAITFVCFLRKSLPMNRKGRLGSVSGPNFGR